MAMQEFKRSKSKEGDAQLFELKNPGDKVVGTYRGSETFMSKKNRKTTKHFFETEDGQKLFIWGSHSLDKDLPEIGVDAFISVEFAGKGVTKTGNTVNNYKIFFEKEGL